MAKPFTKDNQPQNRGRPRGSKNKVTVIKEQYESLLSAGNLGIDPLAVKQEILTQLFSKKTNSLAELELINKVVSDLVPYAIPQQIQKEIHIVKEQQPFQFTTTAEIIANFQPQLEVDSNE